MGWKLLFRISKSSVTSQKPTPLCIDRALVDKAWASAIGLPHMLGGKEKSSRKSTTYGLQIPSWKKTYTKTAKKWYGKNAFTCQTQMRRATHLYGCLPVDLTRFNTYTSFNTTNKPQKNKQLQTSGNQSSLTDNKSYVYIQGVGGSFHKVGHQRILIKQGTQRTMEPLISFEIYSIIVVRGIGAVEGDVLTVDVYWPQWDGMCEKESVQVSVIGLCFAQRQRKVVLSIGKA